MMREQTSSYFNFQKKIKTQLKRNFCHKSQVLKNKHLELFASVNFLNVNIDQNQLSELLHLFETLNIKTKFC